MQRKEPYTSVCVTGTTYYQSVQIMNTIQFGYHSFNKCVNLQKVVIMLLHQGATPGATAEAAR